MSESQSARSIVLIGAGPRGVGWLERFARNHSALGAPDVTVHIVDPFPPGPGRIWRNEQSALLKLNSLAEDVTMFTDESSVIDGPVSPGPSLADWAAGVRDGTITGVVATDPLLADELRGLHAKSFPTRRLQSLYLDWFHRRTLEGLPESISVIHHRVRAVDVEDLRDGGQRVLLDGGGALTADAVVYALGHSGSDAAPEHAALDAFASRNGLFYLPPSFTADADLDAVAAGETVLVRGFGLAAVDLIVLLGEGRGGRFVRIGDRLRYVASGREPHLVVGSRRGVPYHAKITSSLVGVRPEPRYFTAEIAGGIAASHPRLDFVQHVWPAIAKEMLHGYYAELFTGHAERVLAGWDEFVERFDAVDPFGDDYRRLVSETVVDPGDRLDLARFDRPLADVRGRTSADLQEIVRSYIRDDLARRTLPEHSATLGLFLSLLQAFGAFFAITDSPNWTALSRERDLGGGWLRYFSYVASGPPGPRLEEILALSEAGILTFFGAGMDVVPDEAERVFRATGTSTDEVVTARALIDAWLPEERATASDNPVLRSLVGGGGGVEQVHADAEHTTRTGKVTVFRADARITLADGSPHPRRFAIGPFTTAPFVGAFSRPRTNALSFRENDAVARAVLASLVTAQVPASDSAAR
ncbi:adenylate cyclase [Frondihabitans sucicola]|uniref:Adenylate cyclase n=1 Tax=Frondihabitans sucicola TaxID=1268041 RepID=A0ABM8GSB3_9MICO|nr:FAD/NAD(P)-binding protein [Frondihabitans sucicola]BDZ51310.1 adenylate cyclase [Frondihabitans sucicola]